MNTKGNKTETHIRCCEECGHESYSTKTEKESITNACNVAEIVSNIKNRKSEVFEVLALDSRNHVISRERIAMGSINCVAVRPADVIRPVILSNANSFICVHNHPSGSLKPSTDDFDLTGRLNKASSLMGLKMLDHVIVSREGYYSFSEKGEL